MPERRAPAGSRDDATRDDATEGSAPRADAPGAAPPPERGRRATPLPPADRRDAIVAAAIPLLRERGASVTTRELADAACVAEGTLFRVFPDKSALVRAAIEQALDPAPVIDALGSVEVDLPLRIKLGKLVAILLAHVGDAAVLLAVSHELPDGAGPGHPGHVRAHGHGHAGHAHHPVEMVVRAVTRVLHPHAAELRREPVVCARILVGLVLSVSRPLTAPTAPPLTPHDLVALFLDGALARPETPEDPC